MTNLARPRLRLADSLAGASPGAEASVAVPTDRDKGNPRGGRLGTGISDDTSPRAGPASTGGLAARVPLGLPSLTEYVDCRFELDCVSALRHPLAASGWLNDPANRECLAGAIELVRIEPEKL